MNTDFQASIISNDLDSMIYRIESLPAHPRYTDALNAIHAAKLAIKEGRADLHHRDMVWANAATR